jgi:hypothetical protein
MLFRRVLQRKNEGKEMWKFIKLNNRHGSSTIVTKRREQAAL